MIEIPYERLENEVLVRLIEDFVGREGTDYGLHEVTTAEKVEQITRQLESGKIGIVFDEQTQTVTILNKPFPSYVEDASVEDAYFKDDTYRE